MWHRFIQVPVSPSGLLTGPFFCCPVTETSTIMDSPAMHQLVELVLSVAVPQAPVEFSHFCHMSEDNYVANKCLLLSPASSRR